MKKIIYLSVSLFIICGLCFSITFAQEGKGGGQVKTEIPTTETQLPATQRKEPTERNFDQDPVQLLSTVTNKANLYERDAVQNTKLNGVNSNFCDESISADYNFTITTTLCNIKQGIRSYLQYIIWAGLTGATILIIRNGFKLVTSTDRAKQIKEFEKNIIYIIVGVALIISFYWILDIFVSLINFVAE